MTNEYPPLNTELLERAMEYAIAHEQHTSHDEVLWNQSIYRVVQDCGTSMCLAGIICELAGGNWLTTSLLESYLAAEPDDTDYLCYPTDYLISAYSRAQRLLGLAKGEADYLFAGDYNNAEELRLRVKRVINLEFRDNE
jgi:hypothetical protein